MTTEAPTSISALDDLGARLSGDLHLPGSDGYHRVGTPWNLAVPSHPIAVAAVADAGDVVTAVRWAGEHGIRVAVRCTGHGAVDGLDGALLVHTGRLDELTIRDDGTARIGAGLRWDRVVEAAAQRGLAPVSGSAPSVGVVGFLTGGGVGPISRTFGLGSDHARAFDVVTGDGRLLRASATEHGDLFRALRGGKGAAGVVTAVEIDLVPLPTLLGGALFFAGADASAVLRAWAAWSADLPAAANTSVAVLRLPPVPGVPEPLAGRTTVSVRFAWVGDVQQGEAVLAPMRAVAPVVFGGVGVMPAAAMGSIHADPVEPMPSMESATMLGSLPPEAVDVLLGLAGPEADAPQVVIELRRLGGVIAVPAPDGDVITARDTAYALIAIGVDAGPGAEAARAHGAALAAAMAPWSTGRRLPNFAPSTEPERVRALYGAEVGARLAATVAAYDPDGLLLDGAPVRAAALG